jgi:dTDP-4-dehydrorhamnose 3,5-epimerase
MRKHHFECRMGANLLSVSAQSAAPAAISTPDCEAGIGKVIPSPDAEGLIQGIRIQALWPEDRGHCLEVMRTGQGLASEFPRDSSQVSAALSYPGTIKAFHFHRQKSDLWVPGQGMFQVALVDLRPESPTFGVKNTLYVGALRPWQILIPPGIGHGYKVIGASAAMLIYVTDGFYNPKDEGRIGYDDPQIRYDWELQHK